MGSLLKSRAALLVPAFAVALAAATGAVAQQPPVSAAAGREDAPTVITVYSDFGCEPCGHVAAVLQGLLEAHADKLRIIFKHAPSEDGRARAAHLAAAAAVQQRRFWDMHNILFANQDRLSATDTIRMAEQAGLDVALFTAALAAPETAASVDADTAEARQLGITRRPYILVNGVPFTGQPTLENLVRMLGRRD